MELFTLYGPFALQSYGLLIALGVYIGLFLLQRHPRRSSLITENQLFTLVYSSTLVGILGGRILYSIFNADDYTHWSQFFAVWDGGLSIQGAILSIVLFVIIWTYINQKSILKILDLCSIFAPLMQSFGRIGCYCAGCCFGAPTTMPWGISNKYLYNEQISSHIGFIHPTQLYSAAQLFIIFIVLYYLDRSTKISTYPGKLFTVYIILSSLERFITDFWRGDRIFFDSTSSYSSIITLFSVHQWLALAILSIIASIYILVCAYYTRSRQPLNTNAS